jgi:hypothetical protein
MKDSPSTVHSRDRILVITSMLNELLEVVSSDNSCGNDIGKSRHVDFDIRIELCVLLIGQKKVLSRFGFEMLMLPFLMYLPPPSKIHERGSKAPCVCICGVSVFVVFREMRSVADVHRGRRGIDTRTLGGSRGSMVTSE